VLFRGQTRLSADVARVKIPGSTVPSSALSIPAASDCAIAGRSSADSESVGQLEQRHVLFPQHALPPGSIKDQALCFFFAIYAIPQSTEHQVSFCSQLPDIYKDAADDHTLQHVIPAIGLGGLARRRGDPGLLVAADAAYNNAVRRTNHALCHLETATSDHTLIGVLLLGLYEVSFPSTRHDRRAS
jgi:hypothetical protein